MGLVPVTYHWDKYIFRGDSSLETVPKTEASRPVGPGKKILSPLERKNKSQDENLLVDRFLADASVPGTWLQNYRERRTLWRPQEIPSVAQHPSEVLYLHSPGTPFTEPPFIKALTARYGFQLKTGRLAMKGENPMEAALKQVAMGTYDLLVLDRNDLEWAGAILKEVAEPVLVLSLRTGEEGFPKKILVPVDGTSFSYPALTQAIILGEDFGAEIQIFEVTEKKNVDLGPLIERMAWKNIHHGFFKAKGNIPESIAEFAKSEGAQLILMGTHGITPGSTQIPPSVTLEVLRLSPLPLWVVHPVKA